jgi:hypothetical protein
MLRDRKIPVAVFLACLLCFSLAWLLCSIQRGEPASKTKVSSWNALVLATAELRRRGIDVRRYGVPEVRYDSEDDAYLVFFDGNPRLVGDHVMVSVDRDTGKVTVWPGL